jgi:hypothetical protein
MAVRRESTLCSDLEFKLGAIIMFVSNTNFLLGSRFAVRSQRLLLQQISDIRIGGVVLREVAPKLVLAVRILANHPILRDFT